MATTVSTSDGEWDAVLTAMERGLALEAGSESTAGPGHPGAVTSPWSLPSGIGPLPSELRERAERILAAQSDNIAELERRQRVVARHLAALRTVPTAQQGSPYLDVTG